MDFTKLPGLSWMQNGQAALSGSLWTLYKKLDSLFLSWATDWKATEFNVPAFISATEMKKLDYFRSFPHLITFPVTLERTSLHEFADRTHDNNIELTQTNPVQDILTPAACYHFYILYQDQTVGEPLYLTTLANCFRKETHYFPLQRHWSFSMREVVCIGSIDHVQVFLSGMREKISSFCKSISLPLDWLEATDPFFNPAANPKYLSQLLDPVKIEMLFDKHLAIGSVNFHRNFFGDTFRILLDEKPAFSGCVAFGLERWMYAFLTHFGPSETSWPLEITTGVNNRRL